MPSFIRWVTSPARPVLRDQPARKTLYPHRDFARNNSAIRNPYKRCGPVCGTAFKSAIEVLQKFGYLTARDTIDDRRRMGKADPHRSFAADY